MTTVLIVDDDPAVRRLAATILKVEGYTVLEAQDGEQGLQVTREQSPDVILMDLMMPRLDGRGMFHGLEELEERPPVVVVSAYRSDEACRELGAEASILKPFEPEELVDAVERLAAH
jgi:CheY-like chemotaxis protein